MRWVVDGWTGCMAISIMPPSRKRIIWFLSSKIKQNTSQSTHTVKLIDAKTINFSPPPRNIKAMMEYQTDFLKRKKENKSQLNTIVNWWSKHQKFWVPAVTVFNYISNIKLKVEETWTHANWWLKHYEVLSPSNTKLKVYVISIEFKKKSYWYLFQNQKYLTQNAGNLPCWSLLSFI